MRCALGRSPSWTWSSSAETCGPDEPSGSAGRPPTPPQAAYGGLGLLECISIDAGFTSRANLHWLEDEDIGFIAALKGDQPTLHAEALRLLGQGDEEPPGGWEVVTTQVTGSRHVLSSGFRQAFGSIGQGGTLGGVAASFNTGQERT